MSELSNNDKENTIYLSNNSIKYDVGYFDKFNLIVKSKIHTLTLRT